MKKDFVDLWLDNDLTAKDLSQILKCNYTTIWEKSKKLDLPRRKAGRKKIFSDEIFYNKRGF